MMRRSSACLMFVGFVLLFLLVALTVLPVPPALAAPLASLTQTAEPPTATPLPPTATLAPEPTATTELPSPTAIATAAVPTATAEPPPTEEPRRERADPVVTKAADVREAKLGDLVTFTITVTNRGNGVARGVVVEDSLPGFLELVSATATKGQVVVNRPVVGVWIGDVRPNEVVTITIVTRVVGLAAAPNNRNNVVLRTTSSSDDPSNNDDSVPIDVADQPTPATTSTATATSTAVPPPVDTAIPTAPAAPTPAPAAPTTVPAVAGVPSLSRPPQKLPETDAPAGLPLWLLALAVAQLMLGFGFRRYAARRNRGRR